MSYLDDCYLCGDGVVKVGGDWQHDDDLGIDVDGRAVVTTCEWGKPFAPEAAQRGREREGCAG